jgi:hypothetical protein
MGCELLVPGRRGGRPVYLKAGVDKAEGIKPTNKVVNPDDTKFFLTRNLRVNTNPFDERNPPSKVPQFYDHAKQEGDYYGVDYALVPEELAHELFNQKIFPFTESSRFSGLVTFLRRR